MYGQAVGDALGVPFEFMARDTFRCTGMTGFGSHDQPAGTWSDDTSMALATCDSIRERGCIDPKDMRRRFESWYRDGAYTVDGLFDIGGTTERALRDGSGCAGEFDNGNGSLMRILPLAFTSATDDEVRVVSAITHAHRTSTGRVCGHPARGRPLGRLRPGHRAGGALVPCEHLELWGVRSCGGEPGGRHGHHSRRRGRPRGHRLRRGRHPPRVARRPAWHRRDREVPVPGARIGEKNTYEHATEDCHGRNVRR